MAARRNEPAKETSEEPKEEPVVTHSGEGVEVDLTEPEADDDEPEEPQLSRREKKAQRQSLREQAEADREARLAAEQRAAYALGVAQTTIQQSQQRQQFKAPHEIEADSIFKERELLVQEFNLARQRNKGELTPEQEQDFKRRGYNLEERMAMNAVSRREAERQPPPQVQHQHDLMATLRARYPDVVGNPDAFQWALARYQTLVRHPNPKERATDDWNTTERVMQETREEFGMAQRSDRTPEQRRFAGSPAGASGVSGETPKKILLNPEEKKRADAAYPHLAEAERYKRYAQVSRKAQQKAS